MTDSLSYRGLTARMAFDPVDRIIVGRVLSIDDIIAFHGESVTDCEAPLRNAIEGCPAACSALAALAAPRDADRH